MQTSASDAVRPVVWVVDDSRAEADMAARALSHLYHVEVMHDGATLLENVANRAPPDAIVLDWVMPGVNGVEVCEMLRSRPETATLGVLLLTSQHRTAEVVEGLKAGANDHLAKPFASEELVARVGALVRSARLQQRAERAERALREVLRRLPQGVFAVDRGGRVAFVNDAGEAMLDAGPGELHGKLLTELFPGIDLRRLEHVPEAEAVVDVEVGGRTYAPRISLSPGERGEGDTVVTFQDVTEARQMEARRLDFYSVVAHDLRNPLSAIRARAALLLRGHFGPLEPKQQEQLARLDRRVEEMAQLVGDFLDVSSLEGTRFRVERTEVDLAEVVRDVHEEQRILAEGKGVTLDLEMPCPVRILGERRRLAQVVTNLYANAIKFTPAGGSVRCTCHVEGDQAVVSVTDTGSGISPAMQARLFQRYSRGHASEGAGAGTGLGLMIVSDIVEAHGGQVGVFSTPGAGSTFWLRLPLA